MHTKFHSKSYYLTEGKQFPVVSLVPVVCVDAHLLSSISGAPNIVVCIFEGVRRMHPTIRRSKQTINGISTEEITGKN